MTDFPSLIAACESATGPLDDNTLGRVVCAIKDAVFLKSTVVHMTPDQDGGVKIMSAKAGITTTRLFRDFERPDISIDAAIALVESVPGTKVRALELELDESMGRRKAFIVSQSFLRHGIARTWPLAILAAGLRAAQ